MEGRREVQRFSNSRTPMNTGNTFLPSSFSIREVKGKEGKELLFFWAVRWLWLWVFIRLLAVNLSRCACCWWSGWLICCTWWWRWPAARRAALVGDGGTGCGTGWQCWPVVVCVPGRGLGPGAVRLPVVGLAELCTMRAARDEHVQGGGLEGTPSTFDPRVRNERGIALVGFSTYSPFNPPPDQE
jgi:hypothetical protein